MTEKEIIKYLKKNKDKLNIKFMADTIGQDPANFYRAVFRESGSITPSKLPLIDKYLSSLQIKKPVDLCKNCKS